MAAARALPAGALETFTIGFTEASFDESPFARRVADVVGSDHDERVLQAEGAAELMPEVLARLDEPLGDASLIPTYLLSRFTREQVTVALSGDGGDELFAGYDPFEALTIAGHYARLVPAGIHKSIRRLADLLPVSNSNMSFDFKLRRGLMGMSYPECVRNPVWMAPIESGAREPMSPCPRWSKCAPMTTVRAEERPGKRARTLVAMPFSRETSARICSSSPGGGGS